MKNGKHFRKDVLIARGIFGVICVVTLTLIISGTKAIWKNLQESETESFVSGSIITETESEQIIESTIQTEEENLERETEEIISLERSKYTIVIDPLDKSLHFEIADLLENELESRGYVTKITRDIKEKDITAQQRAEIATQAEADITIGIDTSSDKETSVNGARTTAPSSANESVGTLAKDSQKLSQEIIRAYCAQTGMKNKGVMIDDTREEINYASMPITIISLGHSSNPSDSSNMQDDAYQKKMVQAIADGIDAYFAQ